LGVAGPTWRDLVGPPFFFCPLVYLGGVPVSTPLSSSSTFSLFVAKQTAARGNPPPPRGVFLLSRFLKAKKSPVKRPQIFCLRGPRGPCPRPFPPVFPPLFFRRPYCFFPPGVWGCVPVPLKLLVGPAQKAPALVQKNLPKKNASPPFLVGAGPVFFGPRHRLFWSPPPPNFVQKPNGGNWVPVPPPSKPAQPRNNGRWGDGVPRRNIQKKGPAGHGLCLENAKSKRAPPVWIPPVPAVGGPPSPAPVVKRYFTPQIFPRVF